MLRSPRGEGSSGVMVLSDLARESLTPPPVTH